MTQVVSKDTPKTLLRSKIYDHPTLAFTPQSTAEAACTTGWLGRNGSGVERRLRRTARRRRPGCGSQLFIVSAPGNYKFKAVKGRWLGCRRCRRLCLFTAGAASNAVIAALVGQQVAWSWHIWRTDAPAEKPPPMHDLDRNLGASVTRATSPPTVFTTNGDAKDPFVGAKELGKDAPIGGASETMAFELKRPPTEEYDRPDGLRIRRNRQRRQHHYRLSHTPCSIRRLYQI